jgi:Flp pilus assembly protein TadB
MTSTGTESGNRASRTQKNTVRLGIWTAAWVLSLAVATFGPLLLWGENRLLTGVAVAVNLVVGAGMILANKRHLKGLDELQQKIQLEAMSLALGVALVVGLAYATADTTDLMHNDAEISYLVILVTLTYVAGIFFGHRRYQ